MHSKLSLALFFFFILFKLHAQDAHYWTEQYGTRSMLLSNSVVGSVNDLGAVFYNPARLGQIENPAFVITAKVHQLSKTTFEDGAGDNIDLKQSKFGGVPSLVAGTFRFKALPDHKFAYAFLTRSNYDADLSTRNEYHGDVLSGIEGDEYFSGNLGFGKKFREEWIGASWSKTLSSNWSVGLSGFFTNRDQKSEVGTDLQVYGENNILEMYALKNSYSYKHYGIVGKLGIAYETKKLSVGLTVTSPTLSLSGDGSVYYEQFYTGYQTERDAIYELNSQISIDALYKTPFSIAAGLGLQLFGGTFHFSSEYYGSVDKYTILESEVFYGQSTGNEMQVSVVNALNSVLNFGVGYNIDINEKIGVYLSYSTDYSATVSDAKTNNRFEDMTYWNSTFADDVNHFAGGLMLNFKWADITLGATNAYANYKVNRPVDFPNGDRSRISLSDEKSNVEWSRWRFIVGLSIPLFDEMSKKIADKLDL